MRFTLTLISSFLFVSLVLAGRPDGSTRYQSQHKRLQTSARNVLDRHWAGAILSGEGFNGIHAAFQVPKPSGPNTAASIMVGIDGHTCEQAIFQAGINLIVEEDNSVRNHAWFQWHPYDSRDLILEVNTGDFIRVTLSLFNTTAGKIMIDNVTTGKFAFESIVVRDTAYALCGQDAVWIIQSDVQYGAPVQLTNFDYVVFTDLVVNSTSGTYSHEQAVLVDIAQDGRNLTSTFMDEFVIGISHI